MRSLFTTALILLPMFPARALAQNPGTLGLLSTTKLVAEVRRTTGRVPLRILGSAGSDAAPSLELGSWTQISTWLQLTGGLVSRSADTDLGSQFGAEWSLRLGVTPKEVKGDRDQAPIGFDGSAAMAFRTVAWSGAFYGAIVVLAGGELGAGGGHWWSDTARMTFFGGARLVTAQREGTGALELSYVIAPFTFGGSPGDLKSRRVEHRIGLTAAIDQIGLGAWFYGVVQSVAFGGEAERTSVGGTGFGGSVEVRF